MIHALWPLAFVVLLFCAPFYAVARIVRSWLEAWRRRNVRELIGDRR